MPLKLHARDFEHNKPITKTSFFDTPMTQRINTAGRGLQNKQPKSSSVVPNPVDYIGQDDAMLAAKGASVALLMGEGKERTSMHEFLSFEGHAVHAFETITQCEKWYLNNDFQIIIVEIKSSNDPNLVWLRNNKRVRNKGIIIISDSPDPLMRLISRKAGADDYLTKPVLHDEIATVIQNLMFRMFKHDEATWKINIREWILVSPNQELIKLTFTEKTILERLCAKTGQVVSKDEIAEALGYPPNIYDFRRLEIIVRRLRNKVRSEAGIKLPLDTAHRKGYSFTSEIITIE